MLRLTATFLMSAALFSCGGSKPEPPKTPTDPIATAGSGDTKPDEPAKPDEPTKPDEPPQPDPVDAKAKLLAAETSAWDHAKPVFDKVCSGCHTPGGKKASKKKLDHLNLSSYPPGGHHTGTIGFTIREVLGQAGKKATMPYGKPGSVQGDDLALIIAWTNAWEAAEKGGAHPPVTPSKDDD